MGSRLARWRELDGGSRRQLITSAVGVRLIHLLLAVFGYSRTRRLVERLSRHRGRRSASPEEIAEARAMASLAAIAGRRGPLETTCLRRSLYLYGWLRRRGLQPVLQLGIPASPSSGKPFEAHAWVELDDTLLLDSDAGYRAFTKDA